MCSRFYGSFETLLPNGMLRNCIRLDEKAAAFFLEHQNASPHSGKPGDFT